MKILRIIFYPSLLLVLLVLTAACAGGPEPQSSTAAIQVVEGEVRIYPVRWAGDRHAACSITFDDGTLDHYLIGAPELELRDIRGTFYVITRLAGDEIWYDGETPRRLMNWDQIRELSRRGHEIASHTAHHFDLIRESERVEEELSLSLADLRRELPGIESYSLGWPYWRSTPESRRIAARYYYAARSGGIAAESGDIAYGGVNAAAPDDYYAIGARGILSSDGEEELLPVLEEVYRNRGWLIPNFHGLGRGELTQIEVGWEALNRSEFRRILDTLRELDFWFAPLGEVARYARQRDAVRLSLQAHGEHEGRVSVNYASPLDESVFDRSLTLAVEIRGEGELRDVRGAAGSLRRAPSAKGGYDRYLLEIPPGSGKFDLIFAAPEGRRLSLRASSSYP